MATGHFIEKISTYKDKSSRRTNIGPHQNSAVIKPAPANSIRTVEYLSVTANPIIIPTPVQYQTNWFPDILITIPGLIWPIKPSD